MAIAQLPRIGIATVCMGVTALATATYAYLVGPVLRSIFTGENGHEDMLMPVDGGFEMTKGDGGWEVKASLKDWRETAV